MNEMNTFNIFSKQTPAAGKDFGQRSAEIGCDIETKNLWGQSLSIVAYQQLLFDNHSPQKTLILFTFYSLNLNEHCFFCF